MPALKSPAPLLAHERIAFQFSGGKDSTAALYLLREHWPRLAVYWLNSGDSFPEVEDFAHTVAVEIWAAGGRFVEVPGRVREVVADFGPPAELLGAGATETAWRMHVGAGQLLQDRAACCWRSKMLPLHERMLADGITLIVRGQKSCDVPRGPHVSGDVVNGVELYYPIEDWTDDNVLGWLRTHGLMPPLYDEGLRRSGDCMRCSGFLGDGRAAYLARQHPEAFSDYADRVFAACAAAEGPVSRLFNEAKAIGAAANGST
jgi:3'-phosphoadenosine 5'-phosphosulfate sulfotransferase (PAPS reductase)/FAD synthetase